MEARARGIGEHVEDVVLGLGDIQGGLEGLVGIPVGLPLGFDDGRIVLRHGLLNS
ncbi:hypothetical protein D3C86_2120930 [compost metagenome]